MDKTDIAILLFGFVVGFSLLSSGLFLQTTSLDATNLGDVVLQLNVTGLPSPSNESVNLTEYWKNDGSSTATGNWELGNNDLTVGGTLGGNLLLNQRLYYADNFVVGDETPIIHKGTGHIILGKNTEVGNMGTGGSGNDIVIGNNAKAQFTSGGNRQGKIVIGHNAVAGGWNNIVIGSGATGNTGIAIGTNAQTSSGDGLAFGANANAQASAVAIGNGAVGATQGGIAIGTSATGGGSGGIGIGRNAVASGTSIAIGREATSAAGGFTIGSATYPIDTLNIGVGASRPPIIFGNETGVGIGTNTLLAKLHVNGTSLFQDDMNVEGDITAERIRANDYLSADGTVGWTGSCSGTVEVKNGLIVGCS